MTTAAGTWLAAVLVVVHRDTVRDHLEAWHFQLTRETETLEPGPLIRSDRFVFDPREGFWSAVIFDPSSRDSRSDNLHSPYTADEVLHFFREGGWRVLEQRFPRRAYIVINPSLARASVPEPGSPRSWSLSERDKERLRKALSGAR